ncbi:acid phosphatase 1-like [Malania oleifera]|uniref:acid phosphatase 1-like n=1 Tax=Malania oleifera TaxID=397392 RepID=UPI0025ADE854|nr:acid phosphatase 1-like [Malania oleifera]
MISCINDRFGFKEKSNLRGEIEHSLTGEIDEECYEEKELEVGEKYWRWWREGVESNSVRAWRTVPHRCMPHIQRYYTSGGAAEDDQQGRRYERDVDLVVEEIKEYANGVVVSDDGMDAWVLDVDDTCISNLPYYQSRRFGCDPFDAETFVAWAMKGECPAIPAVLKLFKQLVESGYKVFLVTGRDELTLAQPTLSNLHNQGFIGYERLIMRNSCTSKKQSVIMYKSGIRQALVAQGYRILGNVGDQWSDLEGDCSGNCTFKIPNLMYFVP